MKFFLVLYMDSQWNYQEQPEHALTSYLKKGYNAKHGRNSRGMGSQGPEKPTLIASILGHKVSDIN